MDRSVTVLFFQVSPMEKGSLALGEALLQIYGRNLADREYLLKQDVAVRLERLEQHGRYLAGEFVRLQKDNLPPKAESGAPVAPLGVRRIGHPSAFWFDSELSILALEKSRSGVTPARISEYASVLVGTKGYSLTPVLTEVAWQDLVNGRFRKVTARVAIPTNLEAVGSIEEDTKGALTKLKSIANSAYIEISVGMGYQSGAMDQDGIWSFLSLFRKGAETDDAGVNKLVAQYSETEDAPTEPLNLLEEQMKACATLDLPNDEPDSSYVMRALFIQKSYNERLASLAKQFGPKT